MKDPEHPEWQWTVEISEVDGRYMALYIQKDTSKVCLFFRRSMDEDFSNRLLLQKYLLWIADLHDNEIGPNMKWIKVVNKFVAKYEM